MRILFVNRMASMERGGGETFDLEISRHLEKLGCQVTYLTGIPVFSGANIPIRHPRSFTVRTPYLGWVPWDVMKGGWRLKVADVAMFERAAARWAAAHENEFDVVQVCELPGFVHRWKAARHRVPVVIRLTAPNFYDPASAVPRADAVIASGTSMLKLKAGILPQVRNVSNAVDLDKFRPHPSDVRAREGVRDDQVVLLYVARFQAFKNHALLMDAFSRLAKVDDRFVLWLAGTGPIEAKMKDQCASLGLGGRVRFLGEVAYDVLPDTYAASDIKVITSEYESFCFTALEAMATGLPVITTDCGWVPGLIGDTVTPVQHQWFNDEDKGTARFPASAAGVRFRDVPGGRVVPRQDAASLVAAIRAFADDRALARRCGEWNRGKAERDHGWDSSAATLLSIYRELVKPA